MPKFVTLTHYKTPILVNLELVRFVQKNGEGATVSYSADDFVHVMESFEFIQQLVSNH